MKGSKQPIADLVRMPSRQKYKTNLPPSGTDA